MKIAHRDLCPTRLWLADLSHLSQHYGEWQSEIQAIRDSHVEARANINDPGSFNTAHNHPGALMSGVFYLSTPPGSGQLIFRDPRPGAVLSPFPPSNAPNAASKAILTPQAGMLAIFPNWLEHYVEQHQGTIPRISIAMNAIQALALA